MQQLANLSAIFKQKLLRIPDYQRGYAWQANSTHPQLIDFWEDLMTLEKNKSHYTGVLTLEKVKKEKYKDWLPDTWLIENKNYVPYYVVDGQQRLTTCIILIQAILEIAFEITENTKVDKDAFELNDTPLKDIRKEFIFMQKSDSILRSYIFGYETDNPSYEFLKTKIFQESSSSNQNQETLYTLNLENAKNFFKNNIMAIEEDERLNKIQEIYKKVTQQFLFNEYVINDDVDVYVAFETMNNRGKKLSDLELLKNRLIYLSTLYTAEEDEKEELRRRINDCWKEVYFQLGRNKNAPLNDDDFLYAHWIMYFKYSRQTGNDYIHFLLNDAFSPKKVLERIPVEIKQDNVQEVRDKGIKEDEDEDEILPKTEIVYTTKLTMSEISDYALSLKECARHWYNTFNPIDNTDLTLEERVWVDRLNRVGISYFRPLIMTSFIPIDHHGAGAFTKLLVKEVNSDDRIHLFKAIERFIFIAFRISQARSNYKSSIYYNVCRELHKGNSDINSIIARLEHDMRFTFDEDGNFKSIYFEEFISNKFDNGSGYYGWSGLKYLLYEYEMELQGVSKVNFQKISWHKFDAESIEHILPQTPDKPCWKGLFSRYSEEQLACLTNTLGNLLALSQPKNSSLQNDCYKDKRADLNSQIGYFNGSYSENRVAEMFEDWTAETIKQRGLEMLTFMEKRWGISLADDDHKIQLLFLTFLNPKKEVLDSSISG